MSEVINLPSVSPGTVAQNPFITEVQGESPALQGGDKSDSR
jgi:hypothetical protein